MHALQYEITLPADYDMEIIRERVATRGHALDDRAGLGLKAYVIRERGVDGSPVNQYAPFYLWQDVGAMGHFLVGGGGFQGIVADFGRPAAQHWVGVAVEAGPARGAVPRAASRRLTPIPVGEPDDLAALFEHEVAELEGLAGRDGVHTAALAFDPRRWELLRFVLWEREVAVGEVDVAERYEVLHLSSPHLDGIPAGRHW
ncbi:DUF4865 family protein [Streptomyces sp. AV19]|uniref:DUF4865 family protein n=1 Tax=Streptomyces sp. AV19 TaxID=2793068 RepID=UPI0018FEA51F|nr:DUF4865 family protein [Streptomyces sp. AV19]MBH1933897.1 DUF4865 family protein [Streptomyces sp. AV19]MDG4535615.1 DUF4865 family protein [Streptomyces sp. AV19]